MKKRKHIILIGLIVILGMGGWMACSDKKVDPSISHYTCPMHPQIHEDHPGECPICHMKLVPVHKEGADHKEHSDESPAVKISTERQQLIGVKTTPAERKKVTKEIRTVGRVAFDPDLAIAQREFIEISRNVPSLKKAARSRLRLLGMADQEIDELEKQKKPSASLYLPEEGGSVWIYATLFAHEMDLVKPGLKANIILPSGTQKEFEGIVRAVDPVVDAMTRSVKARIEVPEAGGVLKPETYVNVSLLIDLG